MLRKLVFLVCLAALPSTGSAHGIWGHVHVTGWAIENLPPGELRDFFSDPEVFNAALFGAAFTDSGYFPQSGDLARRSRAYSEHTHWEPFVQDFIEWIVENDPPPWDDLESRRRAAFLMGAACHGLQDEIFDSLFLFQVRENDGGGQEEADPGSDGFLALDAHLRFVPEVYIPIDTLLELYTVLDQDVDAATIRRSVEAMRVLYIREGGWIVAEGLGNTYSDQIPWTRAHYMDPNIPGSLRAEINPTGRYLDALWDRLHGRFETDDWVVATYPDPPRRLVSGQLGTVDSWVTFIFGAGVRFDRLSSDWSGDEGPIAHELQGTRWGNRFPRLIRFEPGEELRPGGWYEATADDGVLIDGRPVDGRFTLRFQVECEAAGDECEPLEVEPPSIDGPPPGTEPEPDPEPAPDAAMPDTGPNLPDGGGPDAADADAGHIADDTVDSQTDLGEEADDSATDTETRAEEEGSESSRGCVTSRGPKPSWFGALGVAFGLVRRGARRGGSEVRST